MSKIEAPSIEQITGFNNEILKEWGATAAHGPSIKDKELASISTGSVKLDWALGIPLMEGSVCEYYGPNSVGKTSLALEAAANATLMGKPVYFFDLERKLRESQLDIVPHMNRELFVRIRPDTGEEAVNRIHKCVTEMPGCMIVFDSISAMLPEVEDAEGAESLQMGLVARLCWKMVRKILGPAERNKCTLLFISHSTTKIDKYKPGDVTKGGNAIKDMASQRVKLSRTSSDLIKDKQGNVIGQMIKCQTIKNNVKRPFIEVKVPLYYGRGIDRSLDLLQLARDLSIIEFKGTWYTYNDKKYREAGLADEIRTNEEFRQSLLSEVKEFIG